MATVFIEKSSILMGLVLNDLDHDLDYFLLIDKNKP